MTELTDTKDNVCCGALPKLNVQWKTTEYGTRLIPYIETNTEAYRINHCPVCGEYIRDAMIYEDGFISNPTKRAEDGTIVLRDPDRYNELLAKYGLKQSTD